MSGSQASAALSSAPPATLDLIVRGRGLVAAGRAREALALAQEALRLEPRDADALYLLGEAHYRCGELDLAEMRLRQAIQANGQVPLFHSKLGNVLQDRGALDEAIRAYRRAIRLKPDFAEPHNDLGTIYFAKGDAARAAQAYLKAAELRPDNVVAHANLGSVYRSLGLASEARRALQRELAQRVYRTLRGLARLRRPTALDTAKRQLEEGHTTLAARMAERTLAQEPNNATALALFGAAQERLDASGVALTSLERAVSLRPRDAALREELGRLLASKGEHARAISELEECVRLQRRSPKALTALAELYLGKRDFERAEELARAALKLDTSAAGHLLLGEARLKLGRTQEAETELRTAIALDAENVHARARLADLLRNGGRLDEAEACLREALAIDAESPAAILGLALVQRERGQPDAAIEHLEHALRLDPGRGGQTLQQLADMLRYADRISEAEQRYRQALKARPNDPGMLVGLALVLGDQLRYAEAFDCIDRALKRKPGSPHVLGAKGLLLQLTGRRGEAEEAFAAALRADPGDIDVGLNLAISRLRQRKLDDGWKGFELRRKTDHFVGRYRNFPFPEWQGEPLEGRTILVYPEQGLGDEIMYGSCIRDLVARARHVALECNPKLGELFARSFAPCTVTPRARTMANDWVNHLEPRPDYQVPIGSLPLHFRGRLEDFPTEPYLVPDERKVAAWKARLAALGAGPKIGLSWHGGVGHTGKARRSLTLEQLRPVLGIDGLHFINLQYTDVQAELAEARERHGITVHHWQEAIDDYDETAALVCALDRVVTVCTSLVHLTGALGRPAIVMVPFGADWRYGAAGERMLWYPSVRLVRQSAIGEWSDVLASVKRLLVEA